MGQPSVGVVIPAHKRPEELRRAIAAAREQDYPGDLRVVVVFDNAAPDVTLSEGGARPVTVLTNQRTPGLAGARNTGIVACETDLVAFCDDDDYWAPAKIRKQVAALESEPEAPLVTCAMTAHNEQRSTVRLAGVERIAHSQLVRSRMAMLHSSSLLFRRSALLGEVGLVNEAIPGSHGEDWDILLRSSRCYPILNVDEPLVHIAWNRKSYFRRQWESQIRGHEWFLREHASIREDPRAAARLMGKIAFAHACSGHRREAWRWARRTLRSDLRQWRGVLAAGVAVVPWAGDLVLGTANRYGRGI